MALIFHRKLDLQAELGLWHIEESEAYFMERLSLSGVEAEFVQQIKGRRRLEWLAGRWLLHLMSGREERGACLKDEFGKPYLENSLFDISISHSREMTAVMAAPQAVGVDIQVLVSKIERLAHKYMRPEELESLVPATRLEHLHIYWGAKEALYKAYGRRQLDFRAHIHIEPFAFDLAVGHCRGQVLKEDYQESFDIYYEQLNDYILVYATMEVPLYA